MTLGKLARQFIASHARHHQVGKDQIDFAVQTVVNLQRGLPILSFDDVVTQLLQTLTHIAANGGVVFDDQDGLPARLRVRLAAHQRILQGCGNRGEVEFEGCAMRRFAVNPDVAAALFHNAVHDRQPQAGAFAHFLGGEEGIENARQNRFVDAGPGVANR